MLFRSLGEYQGSRKGKAGRSVTSRESLGAEPEEPSPSEGLGVRSLLFREEEKAIGTTRTMRRDEIESAKRGKTGVTEKKRKRKRNSKNEKLREAK